MEENAILPIVNWEAWLDWTENHARSQVTCGPNPHVFMPDYVTSKYVSKFFTGYMLSPVANLDDAETPLVAESRTAHSLDELTTGLTNASTNNNLYLYSLTYFPSIPVMYQLNEETSDVIELEKPELSTNGWKIRYASVPK